ncbi:fructose-bisphosphate aldolase [Streptomyces camponoticapitis]|uniref:Fructose-bisphosphate aldolase n=1 Tax=Streptomyces camponoticapitis TaxID=1616125 RepID=A0ABQ2E5X6_9ACTN|nr:fructose-bisphosphate aldolase [Streptomyces camponoticapitis]GGJ96771.1 fructose-bisphosphate aldolase [Streptomyces camponoticapitis]
MTLVNGKQRRLRRLVGEDGRTLLVALDHSVTTGVAGGLANMGAVMRSVISGGADGIVAHRGSAAREMPVQRDTAMIVHLSGNTALSAQPELKATVCEPETAAALGADAVSAHITLGCGHREDRDALVGLGAIARSCDRLGMPLLVMTYIRTEAADIGPQVLHASRIAAELGADIVKAAHPGEQYLTDLASQVPVPVVIAGGAADGTWEDFLSSAKNAIGAGIGGLCVGRWVFGSPDPAAATAELRGIVHGSG